MVFANAAMASRTNLEREMFSWIDREGVIPPGNGPEKELWDVSLVHQHHASHQPYCPWVVLSVGMQLPMTAVHSWHANMHVLSSICSPMSAHAAAAYKQSKHRNSLAAYHDSPPCLSQGQATAKVMSPAEMAEYEEKKLKMRKAMGENLHDDVQGRQSHALRRVTSAVHAHAHVTLTLHTGCMQQMSCPCFFRDMFCMNGKQGAIKASVNHLQVAYSCIPACYCLD